MGINTLRFHAQIDHLPSRLQELFVSRIWDRPIDQLSHAELVGYLKQRERLGVGPAARSHLEMTLERYRVAITQLDAADGPAATFCAPEPPWSLDDIDERLETLSHARKDAVLFAAHAGITLDHALALRWKEARALALSNDARAILERQPRHIRTTLVFWEHVYGRLSPLLSLPEHFAQVTDGMPWSAFAQRVREARRIDFALDYRRARSWVRKEWGFRSPAR